MTVPAAHETRALLRAHLSAASSYRHLTRHCQVCLRLERLAQEGPPDGSERPTVTARTAVTVRVPVAAPAEATATASTATATATGAAPEPVPDPNGRARQAH